MFVCIKNVPIMIDAEESWIQPIIDHLVEEMMIKYNRKETLIFNTVQLYRSDKLDYLKKTIEKFKIFGDGPGCFGGFRGLLAFLREFRRILKS